MSIKGQDWASYQASKPSTKGLDFAFIKATEGTSYVNPRMAAQAAHARAAGLVVGFYHFLHPGSIKQQMAFFVDKADSVEYDLLAVDWEPTSSGNATCAEKDKALAELKRLRGDVHRCGLYCDRDQWLDVDTTSNAGDFLWIADYVQAGHPRIQARWTFHQYSEDPVDQDVAAFSSRAALRTWALKR